jgi:excisionase family DNA binding protein
MGGSVNPSVLTVEQVCAVYHLHPKTVQELARLKKIPAFKIGKCWRFFSLALEEHFRTQFAPLVSQGEHGKETSCRYSKEKIHRFTGASSTKKASEYSNLLALPISKKQRNLKLA